MLQNSFSESKLGDLYSTPITKFFLNLQELFINYFNE